VVRPPLRAAEHFERVAQCLRAVRRPGLSFFRRSGMKAGPLRVPTALRASAQERSGLAAHFVAPLWRAPLVQSARTKSERSLLLRGIVLDDGKAISVVYEFINHSVNRFAPIWASAPEDSTQEKLLSCCEARCTVKVWL